MRTGLSLTRLFTIAFVPAFTAIILCAGTVAAGQLELIVPAEIPLTMESAGVIDFGINAVDRVCGLRLEGVKFAGELLHEGTAMVFADGTGIWAYHDLFDPTWRGRIPEFIGEGEGALEDLNSLSPTAQQPKVLQDAFLIDAPDLFIHRDGGLQFVGEIVWRLDAGLPIKAIALSDALGRRETRVTIFNPSDPDPLEIALSPDGMEWTTVWTTPTDLDEGQVVAVSAELPSTMIDAEQIYLKFTGHEVGLNELYVTLATDTTTVADILHLPAGPHALELDADPAATLIAFWSEDGVADARIGPEPPARTEIELSDSEVTVRFAEGGTATLCRGSAGGISGLCSLSIGTEELLQWPSDHAWAWKGGARLKVLDPEPVVPYADWVDARDAYIGTGQSGEWESNGARASSWLSLEDSALVDVWIADDGGVTARCTLEDGSESAFIDWELRPSTFDFAGLQWRGVDWKVSLEGLETAESLEIIEPMVERAGHHWIEQLFRWILDEDVDFLLPYDGPPARLFTLSQSFRFWAGSGSAVFGAFLQPVAADVSLKDEAGRRMASVDIPLGKGSMRSTPWRRWVTTPFPGDRWAARDLWVRVRCAYPELLDPTLGARPVTPPPTLVWNQPSPEYFNYWAEHGAPPDGRFWIDVFREETLPGAAESGISSLIIQPPWINDVESGAGSGHAARALKISPALGGAERLRQAIDAAHDLGLEIVLWYPSSYSLYFEEYPVQPEWLPYSIDGTVENGGWFDVVGVSLKTSYFDWVTGRLRALHDDLGFDGLWLDSWDALTVLTDYKEAQPEPQLGEAMALIRAMWELGLTSVATEGLTPFAHSDGLVDYESWSGPPINDPAAETALDRLRGREYMTYGMKFGYPVGDLDLYRRALGSGGAATIANLDEVRELSDTGFRAFSSANFAFEAVRDLMVERRLIVIDDTWVGVRWLGDRGASRAVFAFSAFDEAVPSGFQVRELTSGQTVSVLEGSFRTTPWAVYRVEPGPARDGVSGRAAPSP